MEGILSRRDLLKFSLDFVNLGGSSRDEIGGSGLRQYEIWRSCRVSAKIRINISAVRCMLRSIKPHELRKIAIFRPALLVSLSYMQFKVKEFFKLNFRKILGLTKVMFSSPNFKKFSQIANK